MTGFAFEQRINALMSLRRIDEAAKVATEWLAAYPDQAQPHANLAWVLLSKKDYESAHAAACEASRIDPEWHWPFRLLAAAAFNRGDYLRAQFLIEQALRLMPWNAEYHYFLARVFDSLGERDKALAAARESVQLSPDDPEYLRALHDRELTFGPSDIEIFEHYYKLRGVLALDPNHVATLADLAKVHNTYLGDSHTAEQIVRQALTIDPTNQDLHSQLNALIRERDTWFDVLFTLAIPLFSFLLGLFVLAKRDTITSKLKFVIYVMLPCVICGVPSTILFFVPAMLYAVMAFNLYSSEETSSAIGRIMCQLGESVWLRRVVWIPLAVGYWVFTTWALKISPWWALIGVPLGLACVGGFNSWNLRYRRRRLLRLQSFVAPDQPRGPDNAATAREVD